MNSMLQHKDIMQLQQILLMQRLVAYLLVLKYFKWLTSGKSIDLIKTEDITNGEAIDNFVAGTTTYTNNSLNQLVSTTNPNQTYLYDNDGNMTQGYTPEGYALTMTYDAENRMTSAEYTDGSPIVHRTEYRYSGGSLLSEMKKYDNGVLTSITRYVRAGFLTVQERDASNNVTREYMWGLNMGGGIGGLLNLKQKDASQIWRDYSYLYDGKGNVASLINSSQAVVASYAYDPFGVLMKKTASIDQPYMFSTKAYDSQTGQYYYGFRFYDPVTGKWLTRDPIGEYGGINLYMATLNNPVNFIDPLGLIVPVAPAIAACLSNPACASALLAGGAATATAISNALKNWWQHRNEGDTGETEGGENKKPKPGAKPKNCPTGTKPIDQYPDLDHEDVERIKKGVNAGPRDWTGIDPNGNVITGDSSGNAVNNGPYRGFLP